ncbi:hypothetical protein BVI434_280016 [Burkholderia vietnamiensis]|nr:hypothetical protein BVI434_280016 [Burkholderia vietnamiensis]
MKYEKIYHGAASYYFRARLQYLFDSIRFK